MELSWRINKSFSKLVGMLEDSEKVANTKAEAHGDFTSVRIVVSADI